MAYNAYSPLLSSASSVAVAAVPTSTTSPSSPKVTEVDPSTPLSNPKFLFGSAPSSNPNAPNSRSLITRGYIKRNPTDTDPTSKYRLKFMFNPATIQRNYVAYLDQNAIDPYNTIYGAGNLVAPPGQLDFTFELLFDRQAEMAQDPKHRGVLEDYDYFDRVIRAVEPGSVSPNTPPDSGLLLVNPRDVVVVFGEKLQVTGRVYNASVLFSKFNHKMVPMRMNITLSMKVYSFGSRPGVYDFTASNSEATYKSTIPYESAKLNLSYYTPTSSLLNPATGLDYGEEYTTLGSGQSGAGGAVGGTSGESTPQQTQSDESYTLRSRAAVFATETVGAPYKAGGSTKSGLDSLGVVRYSYKKAGGENAIGSARTMQEFVGHVMAHGQIDVWTSPADGARGLASSVQTGDILVSYNMPGRADSAFLVTAVRGGRGDGMGFPVPLNSGYHIAEPGSTGAFGNDRGDHFHAGNDISVAKGTAILAVENGVIIGVKPLNGNAGNTVYLRGDSGRVYAHFHMQSEDFPMVRVDQRVSRGTRIGSVGSTGRSTGPHLHFEVHKGPNVATSIADKIDPYPLLKAAESQASSGATEVQLVGSIGTSSPTLSSFKNVLEVATKFNYILRPKA